MEPDTLNAAVVLAIKDTAVPHIDMQKLSEVFGAEKAGVLSSRISGLIREAVNMPIEWGNMTLKEGVEDILLRFHEKHPELSPEALHEIGRCVGWNLR
ncbi:hypothetical protein [Mycobacterium palustre]|uniref:hypothetical protein n=1 Tax=Mycobacterium palustre TaxID=153971 RepID=UPI000A14B768|nr:hypothetical protein [Mycobacterium palustre]MCV7101198.1 hypothetical protein [Mycobacterium palustre]